MSWPVTESNSWITDSVTLHDFVPLGVVEQQLPDSSLTFLDGAAWRKSNRSPFIWGFTADRKRSIIAHYGLSVKTGGHIVISVNGQERALPFKAPLFYDSEGTIGNIGVPTVYSNLEGAYVGAIGYDEGSRRWFYKVVRTKDNLVILDVVGEAIGAPFWMGKPEGPYVVHGIYPQVKGVDCWGGFVDYTNMRAVFTDPRTRQQLTFRGKMLMDREYHRAYSGKWVAGGGAPCSFTALSIHTDNIDAAFLHAINPITGGGDIPELEVHLEHQARISVIPTGESFTFDNYTYADNGALKPDNIKIIGTSQHGTVNLKATIHQSFDFQTKLGTWWNPHTYSTWGRHFLKWNGNIGTHQITDAIGFGEFSRTAETPPWKKLAAVTLLLAAGATLTYLTLKK